MEDLKKDEYLERLFSAYFKGAAPKIDIAALTERAKREKIFKHKRAVKNFWRGAASAVAAAAVLFVGVRAVMINSYGGSKTTDKDSHSSAGNVAATYSLADMKSEAASYAKLKEEYPDMPTGLRRMELASNASVTYTLYSGESREIIEADVSFNGNDFYYVATLYIFPDGSNSLPEELSGYKDLSMTEAEYINGEWVAKFNYKKSYGFRYVAEVTSPYQYAASHLLELL